MYVLSRLRHLQVFDYFLESGNCMVSLGDLERCRNELRVDLSEIEKTFELNTLPASHGLPPTVFQLLLYLVICHIIEGELARFLGEIATVVGIEKVWHAAWL